MGPLDPDEYQKLLAEHSEQDDAPVRISRYQAQKCAAIITAGQNGHTIYLEATDTVARYLQALALELLPEITHSTVASAELWKILDELPWPIPGPPKDQPS